MKIIKQDIEQRPETRVRVRFGMQGTMKSIHNKAQYNMGKCTYIEYTYICLYDNKWRSYLLKVFFRRTDRLRKYTVFLPQSETPCLWHPAQVIN